MTAAQSISQHLSDTPERIRISVTLPRDLAGRLQEIAERRNVPLAVLVRMLLSAAIER